jgi:hypothetical protein
VNKNRDGVIAEVDMVYPFWVFVLTHGEEAGSLSIPPSRGRFDETPTS